jgi:hypothetical protein
MLTAQLSVLDDPRMFFTRLSNPPDQAGSVEEKDRYTVDVIRTYF